MKTNLLLNVFFIILLLFTSLYSKEHVKQKLYLSKWYYDSEDNSNKNINNYIKNDVKENYTFKYNNLKKDIINKKIYIPNNSTLYYIQKEEYRNNLRNIINNEMGLNMSKIPSNNKVYVFPNKEVLSNNPALFLNKYSLIYNFNEIKSKLFFEPSELYIFKNKPICIPSSFHLKLKTNEKITILNIRQDIYQINAFVKLISSYDDKIKKDSINYPIIVEHLEVILFNIVVLPDILETIKGNLYIDIINSKNEALTIIYPIIIEPTTNNYNITPLYFPSWKANKKLYIPIKVTNPHKSNLIIKNMMKSFNDITLTNINNIQISNDNLETIRQVVVKPNKTQTLLYINYYKKLPDVEYGLFQINTDKDALIIPILVKVDRVYFDVFPNILNFGSIQYYTQSDIKYIHPNSNYKRALPIYIENTEKNYITLKGVYMKHSTYFDFVLAIDENIETTIYKGTKILFGYIIFDPSKIDFNNIIYNKVPNIEWPIYKIKENMYIESYSNNIQKFIEVPITFYLDTCLPNNHIYISYNSLINTNNDIAKIDINKEFNSYKLRFIEHNNNILLYFKQYNITLTLVKNEIKDYIVIKKINHIKTSNNHNMNNSIYLPFFIKDIYSLIKLNLYDESLYIKICNDNNTYACKYNNDNIEHQIENNDIKIDIGKFVYQFNKNKYFLIKNNNKHITSISIKYSQSNYLLYYNNTIINDKDIFIFNSFENKLIKLVLLDNINENINLNFIIKNNINNIETKVIITGIALKGKLKVTPSIININSKKDIDIMIVSTINGNITVKEIKHNINISDIIIKDIININFTETIVISKNKEVKIGSINVNNIINYNYDMNQSKDTITYIEILRYKKIENIINTLENNYNQLYLITNICNISIPIKIKLKKENLLLYNIYNNTISELKYNTVQIGNYSKHAFYLVNPTDKCIDYKLYISNINNDSYNINDICLYQCYYHNYSSIDNNIKFNPNFELIGNKHIKKGINKNNLLNNYFDNNIIIINKDISNNKNILTQIKHSANSNVKNIINKSNKLICKVYNIPIEKLLFNNNKDNAINNKILNNIINESNSIINSIKDTTNTLYQEIQDNNKKSFFSGILNIFNIDNKGNELTTNKNQDIYLTKNLIENSFKIKPKEKQLINGIIYAPNNFSDITSQLIVKNNLNLIQLVKLTGKSGKGIPKLYYYNNNEKNIIERDMSVSIDVRSDSISKNIYIENIGNFPLKINNIYFKNKKTKRLGYSIKSYKNNFYILPGEVYNFTIIFKPNYDYEYSYENIILSYSKNEVLNFRINTHINKKLMYKNLFVISIDLFNILTFILGMIIFYILYLIDIKKEAKEKEIYYTTINNIDNYINIYNKNENFKNELIFIKNYRKKDDKFYNDFDSKVNEFLINNVITEEDIIENNDNKDDFDDFIHIKKKNKKNHTGIYLFPIKENKTNTKKSDNKEKENKLKIEQNKIIKNTNTNKLNITDVTNVNSQKQPDILINTNTNINKEKTKEKETKEKSPIKKYQLSLNSASFTPKSYLNEAHNKEKKSTKLKDIDINKIKEFIPRKNILLYQSRAIIKENNNNNYNKFNNKQEYSINNKKTDLKDTSTKTKDDKKYEFTAKLEELNTSIVERYMSFNDLTVEYNKKEEELDIIDDINRLNILSQNDDNKSNISSTSEINEPKEKIQFNFSSIFDSTPIVSTLNFEDEKDNNSNEEEQDNFGNYFQGLNYNMTYKNDIPLNKEIDDIKETEEGYKVDELAEAGDILDEDDEPDPEWVNDDFKDDYEGYFDRNGTFRIKNI